MNLQARVGGDGQSMLLDEFVDHVIGRGADAAVHVADLRVSRRHGVLRFEGGRWTYRDLSSSGTFVDGRRIERIEINGEVTLFLGTPEDGPMVTVAPMDRSADTAHDPGEPVNPLIRAGATIHTGVGRVESAHLIRIGRADDNDIVIAALAASRHHAELSVTAGQGTIIDLDSHNGTYVNGRRVSRQVLQPGDRVAIGASTLVWVNDRLDQSASVVGCSLEAVGLSVALKDGTLILDEVSFALLPGQLIAIVGPTGAGKSTLLKSITGAAPPDSGAVRLFGRDLYQHYDQLRPTIGSVPQDDIVHPQLTVRQALRFGAELRFGDDATADEREVRIESVMSQLCLTNRADVQISKLSGGQRKRTSVALELLGNPRFLVLDEPTSGLDPGFERAVMQLLSDLADAGQTVVVVTHAVASLDLCDDVLFLAPGGRLSYFGPPDQVLDHFGEDDYAAVFRKLGESSIVPRVLTRSARSRRPNVEEQPAPTPPTASKRHLRTLVRRQFAVLAADKRNAAFMAVGAVVPALLILLLVNSDAFSPPPGSAAHDARTLIGAIMVTSAALGAANGVREIVREQALYQRERALGLSRPTYLISKFLVSGAVTLIQVSVLVVLATLGSGGSVFAHLLPTRLELIVDAGLTALGTLGLGLLISAVVSTSEKAMALVPVVFVVSWLFSGVATNLEDKSVMHTMAYAVPSNWGVAAAASTVDLPTLEGCGSAAPSDQPGLGTSQIIPPCDARWSGGTTTWLVDVAGSLMLLMMFGLATDAALARKEPLESQRQGYVLARAAKRIRMGVSGR